MKQRLEEALAEIPPGERPVVKTHMRGSERDGVTAEMASHNVTTVPTLVLYGEGGREVCRFTRRMPEKELLLHALRRDVPDVVGAGAQPSAT